jgi:lipopolysaccharide/colanic/teichoic acid biosynthesis glycosyltransferase
MVSGEARGMSGASQRVFGHEGESNGRQVFLENAYADLRRWVDFPLAALLLAIFSPIILLSMVLVKLTSRGPALYTQRRVGRNGQTFTIYKIRTMVRDSEPNGPRWCVPGDPRVTAVGRFLRWSHLDELPQLVNVLRGDMSLIGPRPERPEIVRQLEQVLPDYRRRLITRPGLTGLAQVLNPPDSDLRSVQIKLGYDLHYIGHIGLDLDLRIAMATVFHLANVPRDWISFCFGFPALDLVAIEVAAPQPPARSGSWAAEPGTFSMPEPLAGGQLETA